MMEGISSEAATLAGHLRLSNLCCIYDSNPVTIEGHTDIAFTEDVAARFLAYGSNVEHVTNPNDLDLMERSYRTFLDGKDRPTVMKAGHECIVYDSHTEPVQELVKQGAKGSTSLTALVKSLAKPRAVWLTQLMRSSVR
jgi:transketolase